MRALFVGIGSIGLRHMKNLRSYCQSNELPLDIHVLRRSEMQIADMTDVVSRWFTEEGGLRDEYDVIFITNPTDQHHASLKALINRGKAFFVEKPVFQQSDLDVSFLSTAGGKQIYVAAPLRFHPVFKAAKAILDGERIISIRAICSSYLPDWRTGVDYRCSYSARKCEGGGVRLDLIHEWDYVVDLMGFPSSVYAASGRVSRLEIDSEDIAVYLAHYEHGFAEIHLDYFGRERIRRFEIFTDAETLIGDFVHGTLTRNGQMATVSAADMYQSEMAYFMDLIQGGNMNINTVEHALRILNIAEGTGLCQY